LFHKTGARKKKLLTDPVAIIPFPNQNLREKVPQTPKPMAPPIRQEIPREPEPKVSAVPLGTLNTTNLSIAKMMEKEENEPATERNTENLPREDFSLDKLKMLWRRFAFEMKERSLETFYNAMIKREPTIKDDVILMMEVDNQIQIDYITPHLQEMRAFFQKELRNFAVNIELFLSAHPEEEVKYLSGKDKFAALARKNPNLHTLKNTFNLDIDY
jgi:hypothetical protein